MNSQPMVGIVVCTHGRPDQLRRALSIISTQTYSSHTVVVIDDGSPCADENRQICAEYAWSIHYRLNSDRCGIAKSRDAGLSFLLTCLEPKLVCMLDDDDYWPHDRLEVGVQAMEEGIGMSFGIQYMGDTGLRPIVRFPCKTNYTRLRIHALLFGEFFFPAKTYMFDVRFLHQIRLAANSWYRSGIAREDIELGARALRHVHRTKEWRSAFIPRLIACWIQDSDLVKFNSAEYRTRQLKSHAILVEEYLPKQLQGLAIATAPCTFRLPRCVKFGFV